MNENGEQWLSWEVQSRKDWESNVKITDEQIKIGAIQRIATALERLADLLDPKVQEERKREAELEKKREALWEIRRKRRSKVMEWIEAAIRPLIAVHDDKNKREMVLRAERRLFCSMFPWRKSVDWTEEEFEACLKRAQDFDPMVFDWATVIGTTERQRSAIAEAIDRLKEQTAIAEANGRQ